MGNFFYPFKNNLGAGLRLCFFLPCELNRFVITSEQWLALLLLDFLLNLGFGYWLVLPDPTFDKYALPNFCLNHVLYLLVIFLLCKLWRRPQLFLPLMVVSISLTPVTTLLVYLERYFQLSDENASSFQQASALVIVGYNLVLLWRLYYLASGRLKGFASLLLVTVFGASSLQYAYYGDPQNFWINDALEKQEDAENEAFWKPYRDMDAEQLMYAQPALLNDALQNLKSGSQQQTDLFFIGFAPYATENVFSKEIVFAKHLFDQRFGSQNHSLNLVNHLDTRNQQPLANSTNLKTALKQVGSLMSEEDVLVLYLTSHGSHDHKLTVDFWPLALNDLTPEQLRAMLDDAKIKWRVIIVSACYSGGFIKALENEQTLVATAASADRTSFGCGSQSEFTYFGEAIFKDQLDKETDFVKAIEQARTAIAAREKREKIDASLPQLSVGNAIKIKLADLSAQLQESECRAKAEDKNC
ncbi:hypothetical protein JCM14076_20150 [Methylosoma difficile]